MKNESQEGLPEIAQSLNKRKPIILLIVGAVIVIFLWMYLHSKPTAKKSPIVIEENYTMQGEARLKEKEIKEVIKPVSEVNEQQKLQLAQLEMTMMQEKERALQQRLAAPLMIISEGSQAQAQVSGKEEHATQQMLSRDPNTAFLNGLDNQHTNTIEAGHVANLNTTITEGSLIHAILEPAMNSDLPGSIRAIVSAPNYAADGSQVLIPRGSRLIGRYKSGMLQGQSRVFVVWTRLITPQGVSIDISSPGTDALGVAGMNADEIDRHFWERFGTASLLSLIGAGAANIGVESGDQNNPASSYRTAIADSFAQSANQSLQQESMIAPTLKIHQGQPIMVFVAHDLSFKNAIREVSSPLNVF